MQLSSLSQLSCLFQVAIVLTSLLVMLVFVYGGFSVHQACAECFVGGSSLKHHHRQPCGIFCHLLLQRRKPRLREGLPQGHLARKALDLKPGLLRKPRLLSPLPRGIPALPPPQVHSGSC